MANIKSAKKRARQSEKRRKHNASLKSAYRTSVKKITIAIAANKIEEASKLLRESTQILDRVAAKGLLHKNKAARYKSRLNTKVKNLK